MTSSFRLPPELHLRKEREREREREREEKKNKKLYHKVRVHYVTPLLLHPESNSISCESNPWASGSHHGALGRASDAGFRLGLGFRV